MLPAYADEEPDRFRHPFVTPSERDRILAEIGRDRDTDPLRPAPAVVRDVRDGDAYADDRMRTEVAPPTGHARAAERIVAPSEARVGALGVPRMEPASSRRRDRPSGQSGIRGEKPPAEDRPRPIQPAAVTAEATPSATEQTRVELPRVDFPAVERPEIEISGMGLPRAEMPEAAISGDDLPRADPTATPSGPSRLAVDESRIAAAPADEASDEDEETRRIHLWLAGEVGRIEDVLAEHMSRRTRHGIEPAKAEAPKVEMPKVDVTTVPAMAPVARPAEPSADARLGGPVDLDERRDRALRAAAEHLASAMPPRDLRRELNDGTLRPSGIRLSRPAPEDPPTDDPEDDVPAFLRRTEEPVAQEPERPVRRPEPRIDEFAQERLQERPLAAQPVPPIRRGPPMAGMPDRPLGSQSTLGALLLAYAAFAVVPVAEWLSGALDPRIGAVAPCLAFLVWFAIHLVRRDQLVQLRILTAWQVAHAAFGLYAIRPWGGFAGAVPWWASASLAAGCAVAVVALSAAVEAFEFRAVRRMRPAPPRQVRRAPLPRRD